MGRVGEEDLVHVQLWIKEGADVKRMKKGKLKMPREFPISTVMSVARPKMKIRPEDGIFVFTSDNRLLSPQSMISSVFEKHSKDGVLHLVCAKEEVFG